VADREEGDRERSDGEVLKTAFGCWALILLVVWIGYLTVTLGNQLNQQWDSSAVATLIAGVPAVIGAIIVGVRQVDIQRRQIVLQENDLKIQLMDERVDVLRRFERVFEGLGKPNSPLVMPSPTGRFDDIFEEIPFLFGRDIRIKCMPIIGKIKEIEKFHLENGKQIAMMPDKFEIDRDILNSCETCIRELIDLMRVKTQIDL
jgi:hypothetical protein